MMYHSDTQIIHDIAPDFSMFALEEFDQILLGKVQVVSLPAGSLTIFIYLFPEDLTPQKALSRFVERNLSQRCASICVGLQQDFDVWIQEKTNQEAPVAQQHLRYGLVLTVKHLDFDFPVFDFTPCERDVQLRTSVEEFFYESAKSRTDSTRIDSLIVKYELDGQLHIN